MGRVDAEVPADVDDDRAGGLVADAAGDFIRRGHGAEQGRVVFRLGQPDGAGPGGGWICGGGSVGRASRPSTQEAGLEAGGEEEAAGDAGDDQSEVARAVAPGEGPAGDGRVLALQGGHEGLAEVDDPGHEGQEGAEPEFPLGLGTGYGGRLSGVGRGGHERKKNILSEGCQGIYSRRWYGRSARFCSGLEMVGYLRAVWRSETCGEQSPERFRCDLGSSVGGNPLTTS